MFNLELFSLYIFTIIVFLITPGPVTLLVIHNSKEGFSAGLKTIIGTNLASLVLIGIAMLIINSLLIINEMYFEILKVAGAGYLLYYGYSLIKGSRNRPKELTTKTTKTSYILQGFIIGISSPDDIIFFVSFFPGFITITDSLLTSSIILTLSWMAVDYLLLSVLSFFSHTALQNLKKTSLINIISGAILILIGIFALTSGVKSIFF